MIQTPAKCEAGNPAAPAVACQRARTVLSEWRGRGGIAVFGAGAHTRKILPALKEHAGIIVGIADDSPPVWGREIGPWTVESPDRLIDERVGGILVSSDVQQETLAGRLRRDYGRRCAILTLYPAPDVTRDGVHLPFTGERQTGRTLEEIELGHRVRYYWAAQHLDDGTRVLDAACGNGYGTRVLADAGARVLGVDASDEAIAFARHHYGGARCAFETASIDDHASLLAKARTSRPFDAIVSMETIEHLEHPQVFLRAAFEMLEPGGALYCSTPNADAMALDEAPYHRRHFRTDQTLRLLGSVGFRFLKWYGQEGLQILKGRCGAAQRYQLFFALKPRNANGRRAVRRAAVRQRPR
ncbi:MAG: methyltransferase domain-containing protein [Planctomycetes bacterium]|nr:methyltransferase domain-containing protein [Planctomycetota bacterium]